MKTKYVHVIAVMLWLTSSVAFAQEWQWLKKIGIGNTYDQCSVESAVTDDAGNTYVTGGFTGTLILGDKTYNGTTTSYFVAKFDSSGNVVWSQSISGTGSTVHVYTIFVDGDGNTYVVGDLDLTSKFFAGRVNLGDGHSLSLAPLLSGYNFSNFVCKYGPDGTVALKKFYTGYRDIQAVSIQVSRTGSLFVMGQLFDSYPQKPSTYFGEDTVRCYTSSGQLAWKMKYNLKPSEGNIGTIKFLAGPDNLWLVNRWDAPQNITFDGAAYSIDTYESFLTEYDVTTGALLTVAPTKTPLHYFNTQMVIRDRQLYMLGSFQYLMAPSITFGSIVIASTKPTDPYYYGYEGFLAKMDLTTGDYAWANRVTDIDDVYSLNVSAPGNVYVSVGNITGLYTPRYIHKLDASGTTLWTQTSNAYIHEHVHVGVDQYENVYAAGWTSNGGTAVFGNLSYSYNNEVGFLAKIQNQDPTLNGAVRSANVATSVLPMDELASDKVVTLTPNPTHGPATLTFAQGDAVQIHVRDAYGRMVHQAIATAGYTLTLEDQAPGMYFITVLTSGQPARTLKLLKY